MHTIGLYQIDLGYWEDIMTDTPAYIRLKEALQEQIRRGELVPGDALPSERRLAELHGLSRMTVRQAVSELVGVGAVYREQGRGTFVSARKMKQHNIASLSNTVREMGFTPSTRVAAFSLELPEGDIAARLMLRRDVYRALRVRLASGNPVALEEVFIPARTCPGLKRADLKKSLYGLITEGYGIRIGSVDCAMTALHPSPAQQELLNIPRNAPVLKVDSLYYGTGGDPLYFEHAMYRADMYEYNIRIFTQQ